MKKNRVLGKRIKDAEYFDTVSQKTGYRFQNVDWLEKALTHPSAYSTRQKPHYERLEFLGDRVLGLMVANLLFKIFPDSSEGELCLRFNSLVNSQALSEIADEIGLSKFIRAGSEMGSLSDRKRMNLRADALEAFIAAVYLDGGIEPTEIFIRRFWIERAKSFGACQRDAKTELQEWAHRHSFERPVYRIENRKGPDHDPLFTVGLYIEGLSPVFGEGNTRRQAEQAAARMLLVQEGVWNTGIHF